MKNIFFLLFVLIGSTGFVVAQNNGDYKKTEFFVGYSNEHVEGADRSLHGFEVSGVYNFTRYIGVKGDFSAAFKTRRFTLPALAGSPTPFTATFRNTESLYNVLDGIQVKDNASKHRLSPFAHALFGLGATRSKTGDFQCIPTACPPFATGTFSNTYFAAALGGGLDIKITKRLQLRVIQVDYNPLHSGFGTRKNVRISTGIVF